MVKADDIAVSIPEMDELNDKQKEMVQKLVKRVKDEYENEWPYIFAREKTDEDREFLAYKYLKARKWNEENSMAMIRNTVVFRKEHGIDQWRMFPCAFPLLGYDEKDIVATLKPSIPGEALGAERELNTAWDLCYRALQTSYVNVYHYWDKEGHPVLYDCCGKADVGKIVKDITKLIPPGGEMKDVIVPYHTYMNEVQYYMIRYADHLSRSLNKRRIAGITVVMDTDGLHMGMLQRRFAHVVQCIFDVDQKYYPEVLHRLFVVNCPKLIQMAYNLVKGSLDVNTRKKVVFCTKSETPSVLLKVIDEDKLPKSMGGSCACEGGCLPAYVPKDGDLNKVGVTEEFTIKAGKVTEKVLTVVAGQSISWDFTAGSHDILFSAFFTSKEELTEKSREFCLQQTLCTPAAGDEISTDSRPQPEVHADPNASPETVGAKDTKKDEKKTKKWSKTEKEEKNKFIIVSARVSANSGNFSCPQEGTLTLKFDNSSSWMKEKKVQCRILE
ncbi:hypothetical protein AGDE_01392 [Angomonas deanei]|uniref:CRAL/TRIO domain containing protein, putative n=1 Tax=Angomonas deanei TaxID=59799 RepID=A0A7G2CC62_9TRYP|nr:hypothetical protein AGDE_01392 [Angomonas deanei]CAD2216313.1 CRAL/TRIO domain containing protein, putative [Angomonas deanei]|eukprot:EPY42531.1 hypothetical protein AGDE_01392 [Angomonas deanei]